jgi:hypothetical protein
LRIVRRNPFFFENSPYILGVSVWRDLANGVKVSLPTRLIDAERVLGVPHAAGNDGVDTATLVASAARLSIGLLGVAVLVRMLWYVDFPVCLLDPF